jgi:hypothetical protein
MFKSQYRNPRITTKQGNVTSQKIYFTRIDYSNIDEDKTLDKERL